MQIWFKIRKNTQLIDATNRHSTADMRLPIDDWP